MNGAHGHERLAATSGNRCPGPPGFIAIPPRSLSHSHYRSRPRHPPQVRTRLFVRHLQRDGEGISRAHGEGARGPACSRQRAIPSRDKLSVFMTALANPLPSCRCWAT